MVANFRCPRGGHENHVKRVFVFQRQAQQRLRPVRGGSHRCGGRQAPFFFQFLTSSASITVNLLNFFHGVSNISHVTFFRLVRRGSVRPARAEHAPAFLVRGDTTIYVVVVCLFVRPAGQQRNGIVSIFLGLRLDTRASCVAGCLIKTTSFVAGAFTGPQPWRATHPGSADRPGPQSPPVPGRWLFNNQTAPSTGRTPHQNFSPPSPRTKCPFCR